MTTRIASLVLIAGLAAGFVSTASAQDKAPARDGQPKVLEGPRVQDGGVPGERRRFGPGAQDKRDMQREIPHMMFMRVVNSLKGPQAESGERLSDEQVARINEIDGAFKERGEAFRKEHAAELRTLVQDLPPEERRRVAEMLGANRGEGRPGEGRPTDRAPGAERPTDRAPGAARPGSEGRRPPRDGQNPGDEMVPGRDRGGERGGEKVDPAKAEQARARLKELMQKAPKAGDAHAQIVSVLNDTQKKALEQKLENARKDMEKRRAESGGPQGKPQGKDADKARPEGKPDAGRPEGKRPEGKRPDAKAPEGKRPGDGGTDKRRAPKRDKD